MKIFFILVYIAYVCSNLFNVYYLSFMIIYKKKNQYFNYIIRTKT